MIKIINAWKFPIAILLCNTTVNTVQAEPILTPLESKHIEARYLEQSPLETPQNVSKTHYETKKKRGLFGRVLNAVFNED